MTARRRLVPLSEVEEALDFLRRKGIAFSGVDIRSDGVTFFPANHDAGNGYDRWKAKDQDRDRTARRSRQD